MKKVHKAARPHHPLRDPLLRHDCMSANESDVWKCDIFIQEKELSSSFYFI
jgi:hypothetical protein